MTPEKLPHFVQSGLGVSLKVRRVILCPRGDKRPGFVELNLSAAPNDQHKWFQAKLLYPRTEFNRSCSELWLPWQMAPLMNQRINV